MEQYLWIVWLVIFVVAVIVEALGPNLVSIWFAVGAIPSLIISFIPSVPWWVELIVFVVISATAIFALRPLFKKYFKRNAYQSNVDSLAGKRCVVVEEISSLSPGVVKLGDVKWSAIPLNDNEVIKEGSVAEVVVINGNKLIVKKVEEKK